VVGAVVPLLLDVAVVEELPAVPTSAGGNACGLCRRVVAGEGVLDLAFTRGSAGPELWPVIKPEPELESRKLEPEPELEG